MTDAPTAATIAEWRELATDYDHRTRSSAHRALRQAADACAALLEQVRLLSSPMWEDLGGGYMKCGHPGMDKLWGIARTCDDRMKKAVARAEAAEARIAALEAERDDVALRLPAAEAVCAAADKIDRYLGHRSPDETVLFTALQAWRRLIEMETSK